MVPSITSMGWVDRLQRWWWTLHDADGGQILAALSGRDAVSSTELHRLLEARTGKRWSVGRILANCDLLKERGLIDYWDAQVFRGRTVRYFASTGTGEVQ